jgi:hypothetical protein
MDWEQMKEQRGWERVEATQVGEAKFEDLMLLEKVRAGIRL